MTEDDVWRIGGFVGMVFAGEHGTACARGERSGTVPSYTV